MADMLAWLFAAPFILLGAWSVWAWLRTAFAARARRRRLRLWEDDNQYNPER